MKKSVPPQEDAAVEPLFLILVPAAGGDTGVSVRRALRIKHSDTQNKFLYSALPRNYWLCES